MVRYIISNLLKINQSGFIVFDNAVLSPKAIVLSVSLVITTFIPFDYSASEDDSEKVKSAKIALKEKINDRFSQIGTGEEALGTDAFAQTLLG